jgi:hypothetical protein
MTEVPTPGVSRGKFLSNAAKGSFVLATSGGVLAAVSGDAYANSRPAAQSDLSVLQGAYIAESLAVYIYSAIIKDFGVFSHPKLNNKDYFEAALQNEKDHKAFLASALGSKTPTGLKFKIPASVTKTGQSLLNTGVALETAFVEAYLGAVESFSTTDLKLIAAKVAADEATHFSFFDAAAGGHGVLPALPGTATIKATEAKLKPFLA